MGYNFYGQLGDNSTTDRHSPELIASNVTAVAGGEYYSLFIKSDGSLWGMGYNGYGQLGDGTFTNHIVPVFVASNVVVVAAGWDHSAFIKSEGTLWVMGDDFFGQLGDGAYTNHNVPEEIVGLTSATLTLSNLYQINDGTAKTVTATTIPPGLAVSITYDGSTNAPTNIGSYTVIGTINSLGYQGSTTNTLVIGQPMALVDWNTVYQRIDGFGASSAWQQTWTTNQADMFFSTNSGTGTAYNGTNFAFTGIGLSLLRNHIAFANTPLASDTPTTVETNMMQMAQARGAKVWSTPWTPAAGFKDSGVVNGGNYLGSGNNATNLAYASQLASYVASMKNNYGINLYALSVQNEPDFNTVNYESCVWNGTQIHDFVTNLYSALAAQGVGSTKIMIPEGESWQGSSNLYTATMSDPVSAADVGIIADHNYNSVPPSGIPIQQASSGLPAWETETANLSNGNDGSITEGIYWANRIYLFMTVAQANAWHFWWLMGASSSSYDNSNQGLADTNGVPTKRMYVLGQYSRFVRPNYYRIGVNYNGSYLISAYKDLNSANFAVVAVNTDPSNSYFQTFTFTNITVTGPVTPWITSDTFSLSNQAPVAVTGSSFTYQLPASSVVTFVGQAFVPSPPTITGISMSGTNVVLTWPTNAVGFNLQYATNLIPPATWTNVVPGPVVVNGQNTVTNPISGSQHFYRLSQ